MLSEEQRARLPKWARTEFERLERQIRDLQASIADRDGLVGPSDTFANNFGIRQGLGMPLGMGAKIDFHPDGDPDDWNRRITARIVHDVDGTRVEVMAGRSLHIDPVSSNVIRVWSE